MCYCFLASASDYGPFTPHMGYVSAIISAVAMIGFLARGPLKDWDVPDAAMPKILSRILGFIGAALMVCGWFWTNPRTMVWFLSGAVLLLLTAASFGIRYIILKSRYQFEKEI